MEDRLTQDDDIDFSMIGPGNDKPKQLDFSLIGLLDNPKFQTETKQNNQLQSVQKEHNGIDVDGSFMRDLGKMEQQLSYETNPYDIYDVSQQANELATNEQVKQEQNCTRTTNNLTKTVQKLQRVLDGDFKHLIVDFAEDNNPKSIKIKQSFSDYFDGSILKAKKMSLNSVFSDIVLKPKKNETLTSTSRQSNLATQRSTNKKMHSSSKTKLNKSKSCSSFKSIENSKKKTIQINLKNGKIGQKSNGKSLSKSNQKPAINKLNPKDKGKSEVTSEYFGFEQKQITKVKEKKKSEESQKCLKSSKGKKVVLSKKNVFTCI